MELVNKVLQGYVDGELKDIAPSTRQDNVFLSTNQEKTIEDGLISVYTHTRSGTVNEFTGTGPNGRALMTSDVEAGDTFTVNGEPVTAYMGADDAAESMAGSDWNGKWVSFILGGSTLNLSGGGGRTDNYSTFPVDTGEKWIDGKTIWRKVIECTTPSSVGMSYVDVGDTVDEYIRVDAIFSPAQFPERKFMNYITGGAGNLQLSVSNAYTNSAASNKNAVAIDLTVDAYKDVPAILIVYYTRSA